MTHLMKIEFNNDSSIKRLKLIEDLHDENKLIGYKTSDFFIANNGRYSWEEYQSTEKGFINNANEDYNIIAENMTEVTILNLIENNKDTKNLEIHFQKFELSINSELKPIEVIKLMNEARMDKSGEQFKSLLNSWLDKTIDTPLTELLNNTGVCVPLSDINTKKL